MYEYLQLEMTLKQVHGNRNRSREYVEFQILTKQTISITATTLYK